ncbi:MAG: TonB-dependent receptor domain-containing protein [Candidatus Omnitrophota bacterium]
MKLMNISLFFIIVLFAARSVAAGEVDLPPIRVVEVSSAGDSNFLTIMAEPEYELEDRSAVDVQKRVAHGYLQDVSILGGIFEDTSVFLNGVPLDNPQTGHFHMSLPVVSLDISHAQADLNALSIGYDLHDLRPGGVIQAAAGSAGLAQGAVSWTAEAGGALHRLSAEGMRTDGLRDDTDGHNLSGSYTFSRSSAEQDLLIYMSIAEKRFGANGAYAAPVYDKEEEHLKQELITADWRLGDEQRWQWQPYIHRTQDTFWLDRDNKSFFRNDHETLVAGNILTVTDTDSGWYGRWQPQREQIRSTNLGEHQRQEQHIGLGQQKQNWSGWNIDWYVETVYYDQFPLEVRPELKLGYPLTPRWTWQTRYDRTFRKPSFTELHYDSPSNKGDPDLVLQSSDNVQTGLLYQDADMNAGADVFWRYQQDTIDWGKDSGGAVYQAFNAGTLNARGFDLHASRRIDHPFLSQIEFSYTYLSLDREPNQYDISKYLFEYFRHRLVTAVSGQRGFWSYRLSAALEDHVSLDSRILIGAKAAYRFSAQGEWFIEMDNLLDADYQEYRDISGNPFAVKTGVSWRF